jgi:hypothetical protein
VQVELKHVALHIIVHVSFTIYNLNELETRNKNELRYLLTHDDRRSEYIKCLFR